MIEEPTAAASPASTPSVPARAAVRTVSGRDADTTAPARCLCYAAFSELTASPHDVDAQAAIRSRIGVGALLDYCAEPFDGDLDGLLREVADAEPDRLRAEYSGLFEVGSQGPPVPIREDLQTGQLGSTREDIVRFYDYFGYQLAEKFAWAPDHLSVELEFMHFLCFREAEGGPDALSYQLAQRDFTERHLVRWLPTLAAAVEKHAAGSLYGRVIQQLQDFVDRDFRWQCTTVVEPPVGARSRAISDESELVARERAPTGPSPGT